LAVFSVEWVSCMKVIFLSALWLCFSHFITVCLFLASPRPFAFKDNSPRGSWGVLLVLFKSTMFSVNQVFVPVYDVYAVSIIYTSIGRRVGDDVGVHTRVYGVTNHIQQPRHKYIHRYIVYDHPWGQRDSAGVLWLKGMALRFDMKFVDDVTISFVYLQAGCSNSLSTFVNSCLSRNVKGKILFINFYCFHFICP
jgi:hypothetical protein